MSLRLITPPAAEPLTLTEVKSHLRVNHTNDDTMIQLLIGAVANHAQRFLGRALVTQTWELVIDTFPTNEIKIPLPPLQEVVSVRYDDSDSVEQLLASSEYDVDNVNEPGWILPVTATGWPTTWDGINSVRIRYVAGYSPGTDSPIDLAANVPKDIKAGMLLYLGQLYEHREQVIVGQTAMNLPGLANAEWLYRRHRIEISMA